MKTYKSLITNLVAAALLVAGLYIPWYADQIFSMGIFALSGALTNWLAVYMLFEKVPGLYGSGVIPNRFEEFKTGIKNLIMNQFFTAERGNAFHPAAGKAFEKFRPFSRRLIIGENTARGRGVKSPVRL